MARVDDFICDRCGKPISTLAIPMVAYIVVGIPGQARELMFFEDEMPAYVEALNELPTPRAEYCVYCLGELVDVDPEEVARLLGVARQEHEAAGNRNRLVELIRKEKGLVERARRHSEAQTRRRALALGMVDPQAEAGE